jgi:hypothetical protein
MFEVFSQAVRVSARGLFPQAVGVSAGGGGMCVMDAGSVESGDRTNGPGSHIALRVPNGQIVGFLLARLYRKHEPPSVCFYKRVASLPTTAPEQQRVRQAADVEVFAIEVLADLWFSFAG